MRMSDANKLVGKIMTVKQGQDMTEVQIDIGDQLVTATITANAAKDMNLNKGDEVFAMFDSTSVTVIRDKPQAVKLIAAGAGPGANRLAPH